MLRKANNPADKVLYPRFTARTFWDSAQTISAQTGFDVHNKKNKE